MRSPWRHLNITVSNLSTHARRKWGFMSTQQLSMFFFNKRLCDTNDMKNKSRAAAFKIVLTKYKVNFPVSLLTVSSPQCLMVEADTEGPFDPPIETPGSFSGVSPAHYTNFFVCIMKTQIYLL